MTYHQIEAFLAIVKTGSLNKAAELLYVSQPSLTYRLKSLEEGLQHTLFLRKKGQHVTHLTPEGRAFLPIAEQWKNTWNETESFKNNMPLRDIRIASVDSLNTFAFAPFFRALGTITNHLSIQTHYSYEIYNLVENNEIDIGFVLQQFQVPDISVLPVFSEKMHLVFGSQTPDCKKRMHPLELNPSNEIYLDWGSEFRNWHEYWLGSYTQPYARIDTISLMEQFLCQNSWAIVPASVLSTFQGKSAYLSVELEASPPDRICYMITNRHNQVEKYSWASDFWRVLDGFLHGTTWLNRLWNP